VVSISLSCADGSSLPERRADRKRAQSAALETMSPAPLAAVVDLGRVDVVASGRSGERGAGGRARRHQRCEHRGVGLIAVGELHVRRVGGAGRDVGVGRPERSGDAVLDEGGEALAGGLFQDQAQREVVRVAVGVLGAGREQRRVGHGGREQLPRRPDPRVLAGERLDHTGVARLVEQAAAADTAALCFVPLDAQPVTALATAATASAPAVSRRREELRCVVIICRLEREHVIGRVSVCDLAVPGTRGRTTAFPV
jgi:hypothetical protein